MSKNTGTSELINYFDLGVNGDVGIAGSLDINTIANATTDTDTFLVSDTGIIKYRTGAQLLSDIGAQGALTNPVTGTGASSQVAYFTGTSAISSSSNFAFNSSESNLTIQRATSTLGNAITISKLSDADQAWLAFRQGGGSTGTWRLGYTGSSYDFRISAGSDASIGTQALRIFQSSQNVVIGTATGDAGFKLDVNGTGRFSGAVTFNELVTTTSIYRITQVSVARGGLYTYNQWLGSGVDYSIGLASEADLFFSTGGTTTKKLIITSTGAATFSSSVTAGSGSLFTANSGALSTDILTVRGGGSSGAFGFRVEANNGEDIFFVNNLSYNITMCPIAGNVGIGTASPPSRLSVQWDKSTVFAGSAVYDSQAFNTSNHGGTLAFGGTFNSGGSYTEWSAIGGMKSNTTDGNVSGDINFYTRLNSSEMTQRMVITSVGNVGIGVTPNAWAGTNVKALEVYLASMSASLTYGTAFTFNTFYDGNWKYIGPYTAGRYEIGGDEHIWSNAPSGSAGATATFTQRMKITSGGNVLIGSGLSDIGERLTLNGRIGIVAATVASGNTRSFFVRGAQTVADGGTLTLSLTNSSLVFITENNTGTGALFFAAWVSSTITKISDPSNIFDVADTAGKLCFFKSATTDVATIKNRLGSSRSITVTYIGVSD